jgi:hypothetical protein
MVGSHIQQLGLDNISGAIDLTSSAVEFLAWAP